MSKQLTISSAFSILMMACYVLFGANVAREDPDLDGLGLDALPVLSGQGPVEISAATLPDVGRLLPSLR